MAVHRHRAALHAQRVLAVGTRPPDALHVRTAERDRLAVPLAAVLGRFALALLVGTRLRAADRFRLGDLVVALDRPALEAVALALWTGD